MVSTILYFFCFLGCSMLCDQKWLKIDMYDIIRVQYDVETLSAIMFLHTYIHLIPEQKSIISIYKYISIYKNKKREWERERERERDTDDR